MGSIVSPFTLEGIRDQCIAYANVQCQNTTQANIGDTLFRIIKLNWQSSSSKVILRGSTLGSLVDGIYGFTKLSRDEWGIFIDGLQLCEPIGARKDAEYIWKDMPGLHEILLSSFFKLEETIDVEIKRSLAYTFHSEQPKTKGRNLPKIFSSKSSSIH